MAGEKNIPMRIVKDETGLTSRKIRYYDQMDLVFPERTKGNQRLFSENDIERLKRIKKLLEQGLTVEAVKKKLNQPNSLDKNRLLKKPVDKLKKRLNKGELSFLYPVSNKFAKKNRSE